MLIDSGLDLILLSKCLCLVAVVMLYTTKDIKADMISSSYLVIISSNVTFVLKTYLH